VEASPAIKAALQMGSLLPAQAKSIRLPFPGINQLTLNGELMEEDMKRLSTAINGGLLPITILDCGNSTIAEAGVEYFAKMPLKTLGLFGCTIGSKGLTALTKNSDAPLWKSLKHLDLTWNYICTATDIRALANAATELKTLFLEPTETGKLNGYAEIKQLLPNTDIIFAQITEYICRRLNKVIKNFGAPLHALPSNINLYMR
jgi:hypothetical protein